jgi:glucose dehydrogenase
VTAMGSASDNVAKLKHAWHYNTAALIAAAKP